MPLSEDEQAKVARQNALFVSAFIDELTCCGVRDIVISPGSRSTPLAMVAYESNLRVHVDIDERGAAFLALGMAKAGGRPVALVCTSGTAVANFYPAVLEAESSRIPLLVLTGDRPPLLQNLGAPQTCDQLTIFGNHVKHFQQMPLPGESTKDIAFARQMALVAFSKAVGSEVSVNNSGQSWYGSISDAGPVHLNFPFDEPLKPDLTAPGLFSIGRRGSDAEQGLNGNGRALPSSLVPTASYPAFKATEELRLLIQEKKTIVLCGEGSFSNDEERQILLMWAKGNQLPLIADPLSNLRSVDNPLVIDCYDKIFKNEDCSDIELVIRFGRYPVSKACYVALGTIQAIQVVVDAAETRDFNAATDYFVRCTPAAFVVSQMYGITDEPAPKQQQEFALQWMERNQKEADRMSRVKEIERDFEGAYIARLMDIVPDKSCVFSASSMSIRMIDSFYHKSEKDIQILCNRGLNGIDGTISSAVGAAYCFNQTTAVIGDLAFIHDLSALSLQQEVLRDREREVLKDGEKKALKDGERKALKGGEQEVLKDGEEEVASKPSLIILVLNNHGGAIFEMLPQYSTEPYFERLFRTAQTMSIADIALGFDIPFASVHTVKDMEEAYRCFLGNEGIHIIEINLPTRGFKDRYGDFL